MITMKKLLVIPLSFILSSITYGQKKSTNDIIINEDVQIPPSNEELLVNIEGDSIAVYALIAGGKELKETVILIPGYPGNDTNFDLAQDLRASGRNVILFNHRGAWGSQGIYTYQNCLEDIEYLISYLKDPSVAAQMKILPDKFILIGRSYGGGIALIQGSKLKEVNKIIALSSVNYGIIMEGYQSLHELSGFKKYMKKQIMISFGNFYNKVALIF